MKNTNDHESFPTPGVTGAASARETMRLGGLQIQEARLENGPNNANSPAPPEGAEGLRHALDLLARVEDGLTWNSSAVQSFNRIQQIMWEERVWLAQARRALNTKGEG